MYNNQTLEQARIEVEREYELECIREAATALTRQRQEEAQQVSELKEAAVKAEQEKEELRRRRREEASRRRAAREKVACLQLVRQVLPLSLDRAFEDLSAKSWVTPGVHQVRRHEYSTRRRGGGLPFGRDLYPFDRAGASIHFRRSPTHLGRPGTGEAQVLPYFPILDVQNWGEHGPAESTLDKLI